MHQDLRLEKAATKTATSEYAADAICWTQCSSKSMQLVFCERGCATNNVRNYLVNPMCAKTILQQVSRLRRGFCPRVAKTNISTGFSAGTRFLATCVSCVLTGQKYYLNEFFY